MEPPPFLGIKGRVAFLLTFGLGLGWVGCARGTVELVLVAAVVVFRYLIFLWLHYKDTLMV